MKNKIKKKHDNQPLLFVFVIFLAMSFFACSPDETETDTPNPPTTGQTPDPDPEPTPNPDPEPSAGPELFAADVSAGMPGVGIAQELNPFDLVDQMGVGWNLGNSLDVVRDYPNERLTTKTEWGNPLPNKQIIDKVAEIGFKSIRIPVSWRTNQDATAPYQIELEYLKRVQEVVDYSMANNLHAIINVHHDNEWLKPIASEEAKANARLKSTWTQIATYFEAYNELLIFEVMNEPRIKNIPEEWSGGTASGRTIINGYLKTAVDAIRATGGNNAKRNLMLTTWGGSTVDAAMDALVIPNDDPNTIITLHTYFPWQYALEGQGIWGSDAEKAALRSEFDKIEQKWKNVRPVILGEWATRTDRTPVGNRIEYADFYVSEATKRGLLTFLWDDGGGHRALNRNTLIWDSEEQMETIINAFNANNN